MRARIKALEKRVTGGGCSDCWEPPGTVELIESYADELPADEGESGRFITGGDGRCERCGRALPIRFVHFVFPGPRPKPEAAEEVET